MRVSIDSEKLDILANVISDKSGEAIPMTIAEMTDAVDGIQTGGGGITPTGNIDISSAGVTDVTNYATATVPEGGLIFSDAFEMDAYITVYNDGLVKAHGSDSKILVPVSTSGWLDAEERAITVYLAADGSYQLPVQATTTITPTESQQTAVTAGKFTTGAVTVNAIPSNYVGTGITRRTSSDLTASGATVTAPAGYYESSATKTVASGTAGTPTATKGSVSNHSVSVTPSVTNTTGYIEGSTKTGTAVTVSASELVSGTVNITASGNTDVTNYATASVASGTATPSATKGTVSNHSISVTPSVTRTAGYVTAGSANGTAVTVSASELVSGSQTITQNGTVDVTNLASVTVAVEGGGGGMSVATATATPSTASASISFTGLSGEPTSFVVTTADDLATGASPYKTAAVVFDGTDLHGQIVTNTNNAQASYSTNFTKSYSNGTLTITGTGTNFQANQYKLVYTYGGSSANLGTAETQVGSGATSVTFTGLTDEPDYFSVIFKSDFGTSSGYQRVMSVAYDGTNTYGVAMDSGAKAQASWSYTYSNGSLTVSSQGTNNGGYFHQPGYYQLTYGVGGTVEPTEIEVEPLSVTTNGTYTAPTGKAYSPVTVNVSSGGGVNVATTTWTNNTNTVTSHQFTGLSGTPKAAFLRCTSSLTRSSSSTNYFIADIRWDGSTTGGVAGNSYRRSNGNYANVTSGYSVSTSSNSITFTSNGSSTANPGSFYNGTYELVYVY